MKINQKLIYFIGILFLMFGIYLSVFQKEPHFYTFFSIGLTIILFQIYNSISKKKLFNKWKIKQYILFGVLLIIVSIIIDRMGLFLGYWGDQYETLFDEILKYVFEWGIALLYVALTFIIGINIFEKKFSKNTSSILSLLTFVILIGLFTEYINNFSNSWTIIKMPFINYKIGEFFVVFQTIGYWLMAIIPLIIYKFTNKLK
ncbi:MAG: hypothetical protein KJ646_04905 [Nanoarchaeota archaeon]|nr:hypothetical protein [Nanoarchaeota archaeon]MBU4116524.1 hypothetical protein [Nanoarchaeota archaeon]